MKVCSTMKRRSILYCKNTTNMIHYVAIIVIVIFATWFTYLTYKVYQACFGSRNDTRDTFSSDDGEENLDLDSIYSRLTRTNTNV
jgi:hypothetical protein